ncbi:MAG: vWA domain-containing protein [Nanoarchaeota archaeon]
MAKKHNSRFIFPTLFIMLLCSAVIPFSAGEDGSRNQTYDDYQNPLNDTGQSPPPFPDGPFDAPRIDIVFVVDSTGSMADEIRSVKTHLVDLVETIQKGSPRPDIRIGLVSYRDFPPEERKYATQEYDLTHDTQTMLEHIRNLEARGGGDLPEAVATGLDIAIKKMAWDRSAKKIIFLVGDAAPHGEGSTDVSFQQGTPDGLNYRDEIEKAQDKDIIIYTISGSGIDEIGISIWKEIAEQTGGAYEPLTYERRDVDRYFIDEGIVPEQAAVYAAEAKADSDYEKRTNTILTNSLGGFAKKAVMYESASMGVRYSQEETQVLEDDAEFGQKYKEKILALKENAAKEKPGQKKSIFQAILDRIIFWR